MATKRTIAMIVRDCGSIRQEGRGDLASRGGETEEGKANSR